MIHERSLHWKYQGLWDVRFPAWGKKKAVIAYYPLRQQYHVAVVDKSVSFDPSWMTAKEMGKWLKIHRAVRVHR